MNDKRFGKYIQKKYNLTDIEFRSLQSDVQTKIEQTKTHKSEKEKVILDLISYHKEAKEKSNKNTRTKFKIHNNIKRNEKSLPANITFGLKENLRKLTRLHNEINVINKEKDEVVRNELLIYNQLQIESLTDLWKESRILPFYILGEANQKGNRFFDFDFKNEKIIYKPFSGKKVEITYKVGHGYANEMKKLSELIENKIISVTITITDNKIGLSFDNETLSGYYIDKQKRRKEVERLGKLNLSPEEKKEVINIIYKKHYDDLRSKKLVGKLPDRYISIDMNPEYIGYCVADKGISGIKKIIEKGVIDLRKLNEKLKLSSDNPLVKRQNNKREFEINNAIKYLFEIATHYKVAYFIKEDIDGIGKNKLDSKEGNHKVKNIWHREITEWQIEKRCIENGIELIPIIPVYTSFIGNLIYDYFDATNAAIEICRRGMFKYEKGLFYPSLTGTIFDTMSKFFEGENIQLKPRDVQIFKDCQTWDKLFRIASDNGLRWRWGWEKVEKSFSTFSINSAKSKVNIVRFAE